jgi:hypothetical protein
MKQTKRLFWLAAAICCGVLVGCAHHHEVSPNSSSAVAMDGRVQRGQDTNALSKEVKPSGEILRTPGDAREMEGIMARAQQEYEERNRHPEKLLHPPPSEWPFPNPGGGLPLYLNFYRVDDHYPDYLLCMFDVDEKHYDKSKEGEWFETALSQVRRSGRKKFPPIKWVAAAICDRAEHKNEATFEQSFKVGAIFKASDVFSRWRNLSRLVARAGLDRHPFELDKGPSTPWGEQRWLIVERHSATNHPAASRQ